jgi:3-deoxy-D-arabino-heptulosonate 7-phosphate (DAHP) synthase
MMPDVALQKLWFKYILLFIVKIDCSHAYCISEYQHLKSLNSQIAEQANAGLKRIKDQLSYMTADNFMTHCSLFLFNKNRLKLL